MEKIYSFLTSLKTPWRWGLLSLVWFLLVIAFIQSTPVEGWDQGRYLSIAWSMFNLHQYLVIYTPDFHLSLQKTPFFYWFILGGWHLFGVTNALPHVITAIFSWISLLLIYWFARQWYPSQPRIAWITVFVLLTSYIWPAFSVFIRFEQLLIVFALLYCNLMLKAVVKKNFWVLLLAGLVLGLGLFVKGPVILVYTLPIILTIPFSFNVSQREVYSKTGLSLIVAIFIPLFWIAEIYYHFGYGPVHYLLFKQVSHRVSLDFTLVPSLRLLWWALVLTFIPWTLSTKVWINKKGWQNVFTRRGFPIIFMVVGTLLFFIFLVPDKTTRYLVPIFPFLAMVLATILDESWNHKAKPKLFCHFGILFMSAGIFLMIAPYLTSLTDQFPQLKNVSFLSGGCMAVLGAFFFGQWRLMGQYYLLVGSVFTVSLVIWELTWVKAVIKPHGFERIAVAAGHLHQEGIPVGEFCADMCTIKSQPLMFLGRFERYLPLWTAGEKEKFLDWKKQNKNAWVVIETKNPLQCKKPFLQYPISINDHLDLYPLPRHRFDVSHFRTAIGNLSLVAAEDLKTCTISYSNGYPCNFMKNCWIVDKSSPFGPGKDIQ